MSTLIISVHFLPGLCLNCRVWLRYFYIFIVMTQARRIYILLGAQWLQKRPLGGANGNSKLIYALLFILLIPHKYLGRIKTHTFLKILLLYIVATMTSNSTRKDFGYHCHPWMIQKSTQ